MHIVISVVGILRMRARSIITTMHCTCSSVGGVGESLEVKGQWRRTEGQRGTERHRVLVVGSPLRSKVLEVLVSLCEIELLARFSCREQGSIRSFATQRPALYLAHSTWWWSSTYIQRCILLSNTQC